jgi:hypothetical protein
LPKVKPTYVTINATQVREALEEWAASQITSVSVVRFELAKFFFAASGVSIGFFSAAWKQLHGEKSAFDGAILGSIVALALSGIFALYMFWPVIRVFGYAPNVQLEHARFVFRMRAEGVVWATLWVVGVFFGLVAVL